MLTGTPLDLTPFGAVLTGLGLVYWCLAAGALWLAVRGGRPWRSKVPATVLVVALFGAFPAYSGWQAFAASSRLAEATRLFEKRCANAGETIHRTVEQVDGVVWMKWRPTELNYGDQFKLDDPYGRDCGGEGCVLNLLRASKGLENDPNHKQLQYRGYSYVETIDPKSGQVLRYTLKLRPKDPLLISMPDPELLSEPIDGFTARYGITWDDISTREDRERWIAGGSLKVVDLKTKAVIAERVGFMMDRGLGSTAGFRSPWGFAEQTACPLFPTIGPSDTRRTRSGAESREFVTRVLKPSKGE